MQPDPQLQYDIWKATGGYICRAANEIAQELGDEELANKITAITSYSNRLPDPAILRLLEEHTPGLADSALMRAEQLQARDIEIESTLLEQGHGGEIWIAVIILVTTVTAVMIILTILFLLLLLF